MEMIWNKVGIFLSCKKQIYMLLSFRIGLLAVPNIIDFSFLCLSHTRWWIYKGKQRHTLSPAYTKAFSRQSAAYIRRVISDSTIFIV